MPNYKESSATGSIWQRAYQVSIDNRYGITPAVTFYEEEVIDIGTTNITKHVGHLVEPFDDPSKTFNLLHPVTGDVIGTATYMDIYVMLSSLYLDLATKRDTPPEEPPVEP
jgi:hypothetical protein